MWGSRPGASVDRCTTAWAQRVTARVPAAQLEALRRGEARLAAENADLRARALADGEAADTAARDGGAAARALEARVAELLFWKSRTVERHSTLEQARAPG